MNYKAGDNIFLKRKKENTIDHFQYCAITFSNQHWKLKRRKAFKSKTSPLLLRFLHFFEGFPGGANGKESACQYRRHKRHGFDPWVRKTTWRRACQSTPVFLPGESRGQRGLVATGHRVTISHKESDWSNLTQYISLLMTLPSLYIKKDHKYYHSKRNSSINYPQTSFY